MVVDGMEYVYFSKVQFIYFGEDVMFDLLFIIIEYFYFFILVKCKVDILMYFIGYVVIEEYYVGFVDYVKFCSMVLINQYFCFIVEDLINYFILDFV